jgi:TPR repeat protein
LNGLKKSANHGNAMAQYLMGIKYQKDINGIPKNQSKSIKWLQRSASQNFIKAQYRLGQMYYSGDGATQNYKKALQWYNKASMNGYSKAQYNLGMMYYSGLGTPKNSELSKKWIAKSNAIREQQY